MKINKSRPRRRQGKKNCNRSQKCVATGHWPNASPRRAPNTHRTSCARPHSSPLIVFPSALSRSAIWGSIPHWCITELNHRVFAVFAALLSLSRVWVREYYVEAVSFHSIFSAGEYIYIYRFSMNQRILIFMYPWCLIVLGQR